MSHKKYRDHPSVSAVNKTLGNYTLIVDEADSKEITLLSDKNDMSLFSTENLRKTFFWLTQFIGIVIIVLTLVHIFKYRGGFGGRDSPNHEFCWHVFFMTLGFTYFSATSLLAFRLLPLMSKYKLKLIHVGLNGMVIICAVLGLAFVIDERETLGKSHFISLHSWMGITAIFLMVCQFVCGAMVYLSANTAFAIKESLMPWHIKIGIAIYLLGTAAIITEIKRKGSSEAERMLLNFTGAFVIILCFLVLHVVFEQSYKFGFRLK